MTTATLPIDLAPNLALPEWQRRAFRDVIDESLTEPEFTLRDVMKAERDRREAYADAHPEDFIPWKTVKARLSRTTETVG